MTDGARFVRVPGPGVERAGRLLSRSAQLSLGQAVVAQNALERVAYTTPDDIQAQLRQAIHANFEVLNTGTDPRDHLSFLDLVWVCAGRMAPKSFDPLRGRGIRPIYPFLQPAMVAGSSALSWDAKCTAGEKKALLKRLLARHIPPEWVYRPKSGFTRPAHAVFAEPTMQDYLHDVVLSPGNPLLDYCRRDTVRQLVERSRHRALGVGAYNFLWALTFTSGWLRHALPASRRKSSLISERLSQQLLGPADPHAHVGRRQAQGFADFGVAQVLQQEGDHLSVGERQAPHGLQEPCRALADDQRLLLVGRLVGNVVQLPRLNGIADPLDDMADGPVVGDAEHVRSKPVRIP